MRLLSAKSVLRACLLLAIVIIVAISVRSPAERDAGPAPCPDCNIVLISIDTLRADHLSSYGYVKSTSPEIDAFVESAIRYTRAYSPSGKTAEAHMSIMTAQYPSVHGVRTYSPHAMASWNRLSESTPTLAEVLRETGYETVGFHGGGNVAPSLGFGKGFDNYQHVAHDWLTRKVERWADERLTSGSEKKFFLFLHTYRVHSPYLPRPDRVDGVNGELAAALAALSSDKRQPDWKATYEGFWSLFSKKLPADVRALINLYDGEIREVSEELSEILRALEPFRERTIIVVTSDHGEEFMEHGRFEHNQFYQEILHVPLAIHVPGRASGEVKAPISTIRLAPTLLGLVGAPFPDSFQAEPLLLTEEPLADEVYAEMPALGYSAWVGRRYKMIAKVSIWNDDCQPFVSYRSEKARAWNSILPRDRDLIERCLKTQVFDLSEDPGELRPLSDPRLWAHLYESLARFADANAASRKW